VALSGNRVLVTGGAGFIGSELVRQLVAAGREVEVLDDLVNGTAENLRDVPSERYRLTVGDVRDGAAVAAALRGADVVFHLACLGVRHSIHSPLENHEVNARGTLTVLHEARAAGVWRFVYVSSSEVYGTALTAPMTEDHPTYPMTVYGASKLAGEAYTRAFHRTYGFATVVVRPFNAYGPRSHHEGDCGEVIPRFMLRARAGRPLMVFGDGEQTRDFTEVSDTARGILSAGFCDGAIGETVNLGSGRETSINDLARAVRAVVGASPGGGVAEVVHEEGRPGDVRRLIADTFKARSLLGFEPRVALSEGLQRLRDWYVGLGRAPEELLENEVERNWVRSG
jgi:UDP-glucose 4-epimerase